MKKSWAEFVVMRTVVCAIDFTNTNADQKTARSLRMALTNY
jgi:hypothetical protein